MDLAHFGDLAHFAHFGTLAHLVHFGALGALWHTLAHFGILSTADWQVATNLKSSIKYKKVSQVAIKYKKVSQVAIK